MKSFPVRFFTWPVSLVLFLAFLTTLILVNGEPWGAASFHRQFPGKVIPDMVFYSVPSQVQSYFYDMGEAGCQAYLSMDNVDMVFPLAYSLAYFSIIGTGIRYLAGARSPWRFLAFGALVGGIFDYLENIGFRTLALAGGQGNPFWAQADSLLTPLKFVFCSLGILGTLVVLVLAAVQAVRNRLHPAP